MSKGQWAWLISTVLINVFAVITVAGGWAELTAPSQVGALVVSGLTVVANFFKDSGRG